MEVVDTNFVTSPNLKHIAGENFSGRSSFLQNVIKSEEIKFLNQPWGVLVGENPPNYISGLAPTVKDEISLHATGSKTKYEKRITDLLSTFFFENHFDKNPFNLSGGEQAILIILCALLLEPKQLAIDTTLEQINKKWRTPLLNEISNSIFCNTNIYISDNRFDEYCFNFAKIVPPKNIEPLKAFGKIVCPEEIKISSEAKNLSLNNLYFGYANNKKLLTGLNYEFKAGNIYHLNGINGAGKSTLAKILTGVLKPSSGNILINNEYYNAYKYPGKYVAYSFQNPDEQLFSNTVLKEVIPLELLKENKNIEHAKKMFSAFSLSELSEKHPSEMPFVIRKRIALASSLAHERDWFILDEPTLGQDQNNVDEITKLLKLLSFYGKGIIIVSHSEKFISGFENVKTVTLDNGHIIN